MKRIKEFSIDIDFPKFTGLTTVSKDTIKFDSSCIIIYHTNPEIKKIFEIGLLFPDLVYGASTRGDKYEFRKTYTADTLSVSNVKELHFPNQKSDTRWFSFLLWQRSTYLKSANPSLYLFELTNVKAKSQSLKDEFIRNAKVTAFGFCSILI